MVSPSCWDLRAIGLAAAFVVTAGTGSVAYSWGSRGHEVVNHVAVELMESPAAGFFAANARALVKLSNTPDGAWKRGRNRDAERITHFFQWDRFRKSSVARNIDSYTLSGVMKRVGEDFVEENGTAVWRVTGLYNGLVKALRERDWTRVVQLAGVLGHYVGDMSQPMHATSDYDGQSIGRRGIHGYFEIELVNDVPERTLQADAERDGSDVRDGLDRLTRRVSFTRFVRQLMVEESAKSLGELDDILALFDRNDQDDEALKAYFGPRIGYGAAVLAKVWDLAVEESGVDSGFPQEALKVEEPAYIPIDPNALGLRPGRG